MKNILLISFISILFCSCDKQPMALFTTDKHEYLAGETIHLKSISQEEVNYTWTLPNGQIINSVNLSTPILDYPISDTAESGEYTFMLRAISKNGNKEATAAKTIKIKAVPTYKSTFGIGARIYKLNTSTTYHSNGNSVMKVGYYGTVDGADRNYTVKVFLSGDDAFNTNATYNLQADTNNLTSGTACIYASISDAASIVSYFKFYTFSTSGQIAISIANGVINTSFANIPAAGTGYAQWFPHPPEDLEPLTSPISGNINCPQ